MIARQDGEGSRADVWAALAAPLPPDSISWRQDGKPMTRDGRHFARFVCYVEATTVHERLDSVVPGEWDLTLELLPPTALPADETDTPVAFKARLQVLGVIREDVGVGKDYKQASTDAFKRVAVRYGIAKELYSYDMNWVEMDGDGKYAKPVEDPAAAYLRRHGGGRGAPPSAGERVAAATGTPSTPPAAGSEPGRNTLADTDAVSCPKCGGRMWDNRLTKRNPKAPDYKCRDRACDGVVWPPKSGKAAAADDAANDYDEASDQSGRPESPPAAEPPKRAARKSAPRRSEGGPGLDDIPF